MSPRISLGPRAKNSRGPEFIECAERAGLTLDDWQKDVLTEGTRIRPGGKWAAFEVGVNIARQNGKNAIIEALELGWVFVTEERLTVHSAHLVDTSLEGMERLLDLIEAVPEFDQQVKRVARTNGREAIIFKHGPRIRFRTRTKGGGRGFSADKIVLDEAMVIPEMTMGALLPTLSARPNPQVWYTGSAVDQLVHDHGHVFARVRHRGINREKNLVYIEYSAEGSIDDLEPVIDDERQWAAANPALGIRINRDHIAKERKALDSRTFAVERLGLGDWPAVDEEAIAAIDFNQWWSLRDPESAMLDPICLGFDVTPQRDRGTISAAGRRLDELLHVETVDARRSTGWMPERIAELVVKHQVVSVTCDPASPAAALVRPLENLGVEVTQITARDYASACGMFFDTVAEAGLHHLGSDDLTIAVKNASTRPLGDAWAWSRKLSTGDISPLVAATLALWQASSKLGSVYDDRGLIVL